MVLKPLDEFIWPVYSVKKTSAADVAVHPGDGQHVDDREPGFSSGAKLDHTPVCDGRGNASGPILEEELMKRGLLVPIAALCLIAQRGRFREPEDDDSPAVVRNAEFHFLRVEYTDMPEFHRRWGYASRDGMGTG